MVSHDNENTNQQDASRPATALPQIDERANLEEGRAARRELALRTAREVIATPNILDGKRLSRLGQDGVALFVAELRRTLPGPGKAEPNSPPPGSMAVAAKPRRSSASASMDRPASARPAGQAEPKRAGKAASVKARTAPLDGVAGWWAAAATPPFEQTAYRRGLILGAFLILILTPLFLASGF